MKEGISTIINGDILFLEIVDNEENTYKCIPLKFNGEIEGKFMDHVNNNIDASEYLEKENATKKESLQCLLSEFQRVALFNNNVLRVGRKNAFKDFLQGLPSHVTFEFEYYKMIELLNGMFETNVFNKICTSYTSEFYYKQVEKAVNELCKVHNLKTLDQLEIIN